MVTVVRPPLSPLSRPNEGGEGSPSPPPHLSFVSRNPLKRLNHSPCPRAEKRERCVSVRCSFSPRSSPRERNRIVVQTNEPTWKTKAPSKTTFFLFLSLSLSSSPFSFLFSSFPGFQLFAFTRGGVVIVIDDSIFEAWTIHVAGLQG